MEFNPEKLIQLLTDLSPYGIVAVLSQTYEKWEVRLEAASSMTLFSHASYISPNIGCQMKMFIYIIVNNVIIFYNKQQELSIHCILWGVWFIVLEKLHK